FHVVSGGVGLVPLRPNSLSYITSLTSAPWYFPERSITIVKEMNVTGPPPASPAAPGSRSLRFVDERKPGLPDTGTIQALVAPCSLTRHLSSDTAPPHTRRAPHLADRLAGPQVRQRHQAASPISGPFGSLVTGAW